MSLRQKALLLLVLILAGAILILGILSTALWFDGAARLERRDLQQQMNRVTTALADELAELDRFNGDWAGWDDTYAFISDHNPAYVDSNLTAETLTRSSITTILFVDLSGQIIYSKTMDLDALLERPTSAHWAAYLPALTKHQTPDSVHMGLVSPDHRPILASARPILTSDYQGPIRGTLIMGRAFSIQELHELERVTGITLTMHEPHDPQLPADFQEAYRALYAAHDTHQESAPAVYTRPLNEELAAAYAVLLDVNGQPALLLRAEVPRTAYQHVQASMRALVIYLLLLGLILTSFSVQLMDRFVLRRLARMESGVRHVADSGDLSARVPVTSHDELSRLAQSINGMLTALERAQQDNLRLMEDLRAANLRLTELDRLKNQFVANLSHELRTPLNAILGFSELLIDEVPGMLNDEQHSCVQHIENSGQHLLTLIDDILDLSRLQANHIPLEQHLAYLADIAADAQAFVWPAAQRKQQLILIDLPPDLPGLYIDSLRVKQVLINLLNNAGKFTPPGGRIAVQAAVWCDGWLRISVSDTGPGIPPDKQAEVFEEFAQLAREQPLRERGSGLGLAIARRLIELHGGKIWIESTGQPGEGTTFHFTLPLADAAAN